MQDVMLPLMLDKLAGTFVFAKSMAKTLYSRDRKHWWLNGILVGNLFLLKLIPLEDRELKRNQAQFIDILLPYILFIYNYINKMQ